MNFDERPILVFWETTKACLLACKHCRAEAITEPLPGELTTEEGFKLIDDVASFGKPAPVLVFTGGDPLMRDDIFELVAHAKERGIPAAMAPSVTDKLNRETAERLLHLGIKSVSISLDGASPAIHDEIRGVPNHFWKTLGAIRMLMELGFTVQINTVVMRSNVFDAPGIAAIIRRLGVNTIEFFYLVRVGRGTLLEELTPHEYEDFSNFLYDLSRYCLTIRTVEGPFARRVAIMRAQGLPLREGSLYRFLLKRAKELLGEPECKPSIQTTGTRDGKGIIFVAHDGDVYPSGFMPLPLGNVRDEGLARIYKENPLLKAIRAAKFEGRCGACEYRDLCGGSRARAYAEYKKPLAEDPACPYIPRSLLKLKEDH